MHGPNSNAREYKVHKSVLLFLLIFWKSRWSKAGEIINVKTSKLLCLMSQDPGIAGREDAACSSPAHINLVCSQSNLIRSNVYICMHQKVLNVKQK